MNIRTVMDVQQQTKVFRNIHQHIARDPVVYGMRAWKHRRKVEFFFQK
jgi:hypothetical protein